MKQINTVFLIGYHQVGIKKKKKGKEIETQLKHFKSLVNVTPMKLNTGAPGWLSR